MGKIFFILIAFVVTNFANAQWISQNSNTNQDLNCVRFVNESTGLIVGNAGVIRKTTNSGLTWLTINSGTNSNLRKINMINETSGYIVGYSGRILYTSNQGTSWNQQVSGTTTHLNSVYFVNAQTGFVVGNSGMLRKTTNGGVDWFNIPTGSNRNLMDVKFLNENTGFIIGAEATVKKSTDGGINWTTITIPYTGHRILMSIDFADANNGIIVKNNDYASREIFRTTNAGNSWFTMNLGSMHSLREVQFLDSQHGIIIGDEGDYFRSSNGGASWVMLPTNTMEWFYGVNFVNPEKGWAVGTNGTVFFTGSSGVNAPNPPSNLVGFPISEAAIFLSWHDNSDNELGFIIERAMNNSNFVHIGSVSANFVNYIDNNGLITGNTYRYRVAAYNSGGLSSYSNIAIVQLVDILPISSIVPSEFNLYNNYPNPFNPETKIKFDVPSLKPVRIEVYNLNGVLIEELLNSNLNAGQYEVVFNSNGLSSGVYYFRMIAGDYVKSKKMILLK